jgi:hypothetical protein
MYAKFSVARYQFHRNHLGWRNSFGKSIGYLIREMYCDTVFFFTSTPQDYIELNDEIEDEWIANKWFDPEKDKDYVHGKSE